MAKEKLNIVDENDNVIGVEERNVIHEKGLLHREIHVYFVTPKNEIIFQHRAKSKDTFPDLLDGTVGGHVEIGDSYEKTAVKETLEETGLIISENNLISIDKVCDKSRDEVSGKINYAFKKEFVYIYEGRIEDLKIEKGKSFGFEVWTIKNLKNIEKKDVLRFVPYIYNFTNDKLIRFIENRF